MNEQIKQRITQLNNGEVPSGYEKTEFGIFPCDWVKDKKLKDLGTFGKGKGIPGDKMTSEGVPCVGYGDIYMKYNHFHFEEAQTFVDEETASESQPIEKGTLLFTGTGETADEIGKCVCYNGDETIYAGGDIITFVSKEVDPLFLAYQQYQEFSLRKKASYGQGHSVVHIQRENLEKLNVAYPKSIEEQSKIAEILMKWDEAIKFQESYNDYLEIRKMYLMRKLLSPSEAWKRAKLGDIAEMYAGGTPSTKIPEYWGGDIPWIQSGLIQNNYIDINCIDGRITEQGLKNSSTDWIRKNSVLVAITGATCANIAYLKCDATANQSVISITTSYVNPLYLYFCLQNARKQLLSLQNGSAQGGLTLKYLESFEIMFPGKDEQNRTVDVLLSVDDEIALNKEKIEKLKKQRKVLQQYLLNGIVRV